MKKKVWMLMIVVLAAVGCGGSSDDAATGDDAEMRASALQCTPAKTTKSPSFAHGVELSSNARTLKLTAPSGDAWAFTRQAKPPTTKFKDFDRYVSDDGKSIALVKNLPDGGRALHLAPPFASEDYTCKPGARNPDRHDLSPGDVCSFDGERTGYCARGACTVSREEDGILSRCE